MALTLLLAGTVLLLAGTAAISLALALIVAGLLCMTGAVALAAVQENATPKAQVPE